jgi:hypothetical protein
MSLIEFNVFVKFFNIKKELDVRNDYNISNVKKYICKSLKINSNFDTYFDLYFNNTKMYYGVIGDYNIKEDMTLHVYLKINSGINSNINNKIINSDDMKYDSLNDIINYIQNNIIKKEEKIEDMSENIEINNKRLIENMNTHNKLQELLKKMNKK